MNRKEKYKSEIAKLTSLREAYQFSIAEGDLRKHLDTLLCQCYHFLIHGNLEDYVKVNRDRLHKFLYAAAGEGFVLDGVDAADLYKEVFPDFAEEPDPTEEELNAILAKLDPQGRHKFASTLASVVPVRTGGYGQITSGIEYLVFATYEQKLKAWKLMQ